jgi:ElaB/YqjD/DUF883 family membrane-anchored ribosome-binding protein
MYAFRFERVDSIVRGSSAIPYKEGSNMATMRNPRSNDGGVATSIRHGVESAADVAEKRIEEAGANLGANLEELEARLREVSDRLADAAKTMRSMASQQVHEHPVAAFGIAFLSGVAIAKLLQR